MAAKLPGLFLLAVIMLICANLLLISRSPGHLTKHGTENAMPQLLACADGSPSSNTDCEAIMKFIRTTRAEHDLAAYDLAETITTRADEEGAAPADAIDDCYSDLDILSRRSRPFANMTHMRVHYLDSLRRCGHAPKLMSRRTEPRTDDLALPVPNVVHFIWSHPYSMPHLAMTFMQYMSLLSVERNTRPRYILWHGAEEPFGYWWQRVVDEVPNVYYLNWTMPVKIYGQQLIKVYYKSDVLRLWLLIVHGGMYFDTDVIVLKSFDPLRRHKLVEGRELRFTLANGIIVAEPWSLFLRMALDAYRQFNRNIFFYASMNLPNLISSLFPESIHVEDRDLLYPTWPHVKKLYTEHLDWSTNYCIHIFGEDNFGHLIPNNSQEMDVSNTTLGMILRHVYYGSTNMRT